METPLLSRSNDVIVVGAGIVGMACALELQAAGQRVLVLDRAGVGEGCSYGNAGHIAVEHIFPLSSPAMLKAVPKMLMDRNGPLSIRLPYLPRLLPWLVRFLWAGRPAQVARATRAIAALNAEAMAAWQALDDRFGLKGLLKLDGTLVAYGSAAGLEAGRREAGHLAGFGIETQLFDRAALRAFDPGLNPAMRGGLYFPRSAHVADPHAVVKALSNAFERLGGHVLKADVAGLGTNTVHTGDGQAFRSQHIVLAAGAFSQRLLKPLGYRFPLETERGYHLTLEGPSVSPRIPTTFFERRFVATPMAGGLRLAGRVELGGLTLPMRRDQADALMPLGQDLLPGLAASTATPWMGFRPTLPDSLPVIGPAPGHSGLWLAFGHHHLGLTQGPLTGRLIAALVTGTDPGLDLAPYAAARFS